VTRPLKLQQDRLTGEITHVESGGASGPDAFVLPLQGSGDVVLVLETEAPSAPPPSWRAIGETASGLTRPLPFLIELEQTLEQRKRSTSEKSYTRSLFDKGAPKIGAKIEEEAGELARAIAEESDERVANEAADLLYHMLVGLRFRDVELREVVRVLHGRFGTSGHAEKASRKPSASE
jgi:phosphoribosyl-ATP pyrophosphohydrolase/phosphoribosyl-AMP cyclohydrolase